MEETVSQPLVVESVRVPEYGKEGASFHPENSNYRYGLDSSIKIQIRGDDGLTLQGRCRIGINDNLKV